MMLDEERQVRKANRRYRDYERTRALNRRDVIRALANHKSGREFLYWLLEIGHMGRNPFSTNALTTAFACGESNVSQQIQAAFIEAAPSDYMKMLKEEDDARRTFDTTYDNERADELDRTDGAGDTGGEAAGDETP